MNTPGTAHAATPWHLWLVGVATLLFNAMGIISYTATRLGMLAELGLSPDQIAFMDSYPAWISGFWALGCGAPLPDRCCSCCARDGRWWRWQRRSSV